MGLFSFIKKAGDKMLNRDDDKDDGVVKPPSTLLREAGIDPSDLKYAFEGSKLTVSGRLSSQNDKEKAVLILGNTEGIETVVDNIWVGPAAATGSSVQAPDRGVLGDKRTQVTDGGDATPEDWESDTYTVKSGDTLSGIAKKVYGNGNKYMKIFEANKPMLSDPDKIYPGQVLRIPNAD